MTVTTKGFALFITSAVLTGSFALAVVDQNFRHDFIGIAVPGMRTLAVLVNDTKDESRNKDKSQQENRKG